MAQIEDFNIETAAADDLRLGLYEATTSDLADILGVTVSTVLRWTREEKVLPEREWNFTGGRPTYVYDLRSVSDDISLFEDQRRAPEYLRRLDAEGNRRLAEEQKDQALRDEHGSQQADETVNEAESVEDGLRRHLRNLTEQVDLLESLHADAVALALRFAQHIKFGTRPSQEESLRLLSHLLDTAVPAVQ